MVITIVTRGDKHEAMGKAVLKLLDAIQLCGIADDDLQCEVNPTAEALHKTYKPRKNYRALLPDNNRIAHIEQTMADLGKTTIKAIVYGDIAHGTVEGRLRSKRDIANERKFPNSTVEREIGFLLKGGLIESLEVEKTE